MFIDKKEQFLLDNIELPRLPGDKSIISILSPQYNDFIKKLDNKYLKSYLELEIAYNVLRKKCKTCGYLDTFEPTDCGECYITKIRYHIEHAISVITECHSEKIYKLENEIKIAACNISEEYFKNKSDNSIKNNNLFNKTIIDQLYTAILNCRECNGYCCQGCSYAIQHIHIHQAIKLIKEKDKDKV